MRELVVLGISGQVPTRHRHLNGYLLRWDEEALLFDPGEGTQRQLLLAGVASPSISRILITHFHGDHCTGLPGVMQRLTLDGAAGPVAVHYPASGQEYLDHLLRSSIHHAGGVLELRPVAEPGLLSPAPPFNLTAARLDHRVDTFGYRLEEPERRHMIPERLASLGIEGPAVGELLRRGTIEAAGRTVAVEEVSEVRPGQSFAFVMDTRVCDGALELADGVDMLVCESTYSSAEQKLAQRYGHLTAAQAGRIAAEAGARLLVLSHFSQRYDDTGPLVEEARAVFPDAVAAEELARIPVPAREEG